MKVYKNREVLSGKEFKAKLNGRYYQFTIMKANNESITIYKTIPYSEMNFANSSSLQGIIKGIIIDNSIDDDDLSKMAFASRTKLKNTPILIDGYKFKFGQITNSSVMLEFSMDIDDLLESEDDTFSGNIKNFVLDNLMDNPPKIKRNRNYYGSYNVPYLMRSGTPEMYFTSVGRTRTVITEEELERNREKFKDQIEEERIKREKAEQLKKEFDFNKKSKKRDFLTLDKINRG